ncbi:MAG: 4-alpha-glucanotransferase, partial [Endomicrobiales bacterium]
KLTYISRYFKTYLKKAGTSLVQFMPLVKPRNGSPFDGIDLRAGDDDLVNLLESPEAAALIESEVRDAMSKQEKKARFAETRFKTDASDGGQVNRARVRQQQLDVAVQAFAQLKGKRLKAFNDFVKAPANRWLTGYADAMAAEMTKTAGGKAFNEAVNAYLYLQWLFALQTRQAVADLRREGGKAMFWLDIDGTRSAGEIAEALKHWFSFGFEGVRITIRNSGIVDAAFIDRLQEAVASVKPEAVVAVQLPQGAPEEALRRVNEKGLISIRLLSEMAPGSKAGGNEWVEIDSPEKLVRPGDIRTYRDNYGEDTGESFYRELVRSAVVSGAPYVSFVMGTLWGEKLPVGGRDGRYDYRMPAEGDARMRFRLAEGFSRLLKTPRLATPEAFYDEGYRKGVQVPTLPELSESQWSELSTLFIQAASRSKAVESGSARELLPRVLGLGGMGRSEWPEGWEYIKIIEKRMKAGTEADRNGHGLQLAGFVTGLIERMAEERFVRLKGQPVLLENETDRRIARKLLAVLAAMGEDTGAAQDRAPQPRDFAAGDTPLRRLVKTVSDAISSERTPAEIREELNPALSELLRDGTLFFSENETDKTALAWAAARILELMIEPGMSAAIEKEVAPAALEAIRTMLTAA